MANMSYCRFENTLRDLRDCFAALEEEGLVCEDDSPEEARARAALVVTCEGIAKEFGGQR